MVERFRSTNKGQQDDLVGRFRSTKYFHRPIPFIYNAWHARSNYSTHLVKLSFDEILDVIAAEMSSKYYKIFSGDGGEGGHRYHVIARDSDSISISSKKQKGENGLKTGVFGQIE